MPPVDLGTEALALLRRNLGVGGGWTADELVRWSYWGALQSASSELVSVAGGVPTWRIRLSTRLLDGFMSTPAQIAALLAVLPHATLGGLVAGTGRRKPLEMISAVDIHEGNLGSIMRLLAVAARSQAADARHLLSGSKKLAAAGLITVIDADASLPETFLHAGEMVLRESSGEGVSWSKREIALCIDALRPGEARAVETPWGVSADFALEWTSQVRSVLEVRPDGARPMLGKGIGVSLWTPVRGGPLDALQWNEREAGPDYTVDALGGWWAPEGGFLVHRSFYPASLCTPDLVSHVLQSYTRRAHAANTYVAARE